MVKFEVITNKRVETKSVPTSWDEVTFDKYVELINYDDGTLERRIAILVGIDYDLINTLRADDIVNLIPIIAFSFEYDEILNTSSEPEEYKDFNIGLQSWAKLEKAKQAIAKLDGKDTINAGAEIVQIYTDRDIKNEPVTKVLGVVNFFLRKYLDFTTVLNN